MDMLTAPAAVSKDCEPIPGYRLQERVGVGGYGEVWKAIAPGGIAKAVKIIYGQIGDTRAIREMRSLQRAKSLNHPFLLSIERIEVTDSQLIIVTELADATLRDRFEQYVAQGQVGIDRDELLQYMREAADALDFLFDIYALQHLDVKPENLLMFGTHVKVADFGLMKNLQESCVSLVNGLTPRYSSPETFEGKPGRHSDQYSLAVLYQELVSGTLPFAGKNIAALASQHLNCAADLSALSPLDRFAVGKALSKDPDRRFANCRDFVQRLMHRSNAVMTMEGHDAKAETQKPAHAPSRSRRAETDQDVVSGSSRIVHDGCTIQMAAPEVHSLPRLNVADKSPTYRPTVFVGIGGTGGRVLSRLRQMLCNDLGPAKSLPALQFVYVDTDSDLARDVAADQFKDGLTDDEIVIAPLRPTQEYRESAISRLDSISRRWIYNVPRELRTQGLRALGRLALLDHSQKVLDRIKKAIVSCTDGEAIATTAAATRLDFQECDPRVFIVSSISGGTGGGMAIDVGYAVRQVMAECGFADDEVTAFLTYSNGTGASACSFAPANAYAFLDELRYFSQVGCDYPGEAACGLARFRENGPTFSSTYLFDFGNGISNTEFAEQADCVAEYLYASTVSACSLLLDESRRSERDVADSESFRLRTAGLCPFAAATRDDPSEYADQLCKYVVRKWKVGIDLATEEDQVRLTDLDRFYQACDPKDENDSDASRLVAQQFESLALSVTGISTQIADLFRKQMSCDPVVYLHSVVSDTLNDWDMSTSTDQSAVAMAQHRLQMIMGSQDDPLQSTDPNLISLRDEVLPATQEIGSRIGVCLRDWILAFVDTDSARVDGARRVAASVKAQLAHLQHQAATKVAEAKSDLQDALGSVCELDQKPLPKRRSGRKLVVAQLQTYADCLLAELSRTSVCRVLDSISAFVNSASDQSRDMWKNLTQLADQFRAIDDDEHEQTSGREIHPRKGRLASIFAQRKLELIQRLDRSIEAKLFGEKGQLRQSVVNGNHLDGRLAMHMRRLARQVLLQACRDDSKSYLHTVLAGQNTRDFTDMVKRCLHQATPEILTFGGGKRLLISASEDLKGTTLESEIGRISQQTVNAIYQKNSDLCFCIEVEGLPWDGIENHFIRQRHDSQELASRLHTRINLDWTIL